MSSDRDEKKTETITTKCGVTLSTALMRLAAKQDKSLSAYVEEVLNTHVFGVVNTVTRRQDDSKV